jgi:hypothetical protein
MEDGGSRMEGSRMQDGGLKIEDGGSRMDDRRLRIN